MNHSFLAISLLFIGLNAQAQDWTQCPTSTGGKVLEKWRAKLAEQIAIGNGQAAMDKLKQCFTTVPRCYNDLKYYADKKLNPGAHATGNDQFDTQDLTLKSVQDFPEAFRAGDNALRIPDNIMELAASDPSIEALKYRTRSTGGFDSGSGLFIATISTPQYDVVLQTSPAHQNDPNDPSPNPNFTGNFAEGRNVLTVITVDKTKKPAVGQLRLMEKREDGNGYEWSNRTESLGFCAGCHTSPMRPISPIGYKAVNSENRMTPEQEAQVDAINNILKQPMSWGGKKVGDREIRFGPSIDSFATGWAPKDSPTRKEDFLKTCATAEPTLNYSGFGGYQANFTQGNPVQIDYAKLAQAMNCVECHNNQNRGVLHEGYSFSEIKFKVAVDKSMPEHLSLNTDERLALLACLRAEGDNEGVRQAWKKSGDWMNYEKCFGDQGAVLAPVAPSNNGTSTEATGQ